MPYQFNESRRHKVPRAKYRVTNWPEYDAALAQRGIITVWFTEEAVAAWHAPATGARGGIHGDELRTADQSYGPVANLTTVGQVGWSVGAGDDENGGITQPPVYPCTNAHYMRKSAWRANVTGILKATEPLMWNVSKS
jgi:hypothetical protein